MKTQTLSLKLLLPIIIFMLSVSVLTVLMVSLKKDADYILAILLFSTLLTILFIILTLKQNLHRPVAALISDIHECREIRETGIEELDTIVAAINNTFGKLNRQTAQYQALHSIAVSLHELSSTDEILDLIIDRARQMINAEVSAIVLYNEEGRVKKIITRGTEMATKGKMPEGKGMLELMRLSLSAVRVDNVAGHPAFSGAFPEGHPFITNLLACPIFSSEGKPAGALYFGNKEGGFTDDDEKTLKAVSADAAIALNKAESLTRLKMFRQVIDSAFDVIIVTDSGGHITYVNPAFSALTGYSKKEALGQKTSILKSGYHNEGFYKNLWNTIKAGNAWQGEFINRKKNGEIYQASAVIFPIYSEGNIQYAAIQRDVTQEKRLYEQLLRAQKMEAIGTLAGGIAHDFNNILTAVLGYSELMMGMTTEDDHFYKYASVINNAAQKGADLARKILTISRKEKIEAKPVNINDIVMNSVELLQRSIPKNIEISLSLAENISTIMADPSQIQQVILNLVVNARDAMQDGGRLTIESAMVGMENGAANNSASGKGEFVKLSVSDTGIGMDTETQRKIFDPFFTTKAISKGTGLGLYIVHSVISNHGGYINLYSEPSKGTRFNIYFPAAKETEAEESCEAEDIRGSGTILVIDDEADIRALCKDMLEPLGYTVMLAESGSEGINIFREAKDSISLVILDMIMPKMGGSEVFQALRTIAPGAKVMLCSGYSHEGFAGMDKLLKSGAVSFVQKPFTRHTIACAIKRASA